MFHVEHFNRSNQEGLHCARQPALCSTWNIAVKSTEDNSESAPHRMFHVEHSRGTLQSKTEDPHRCADHSGRSSSLFCAKAQLRPALL